MGDERQTQQVVDSMPFGCQFAVLLIVIGFIGGAIIGYDLANGNLLMELGCVVAGVCGFPSVVLILIDKIRGRNHGPSVSGRPK
jgi:shikimate kinase